MPELRLPALTPGFAHVRMEIAALGIALKAIPAHVTVRKLLKMGHL